MKLKADMIYNPNTTTAEIQDIPLEKVYEWIKTGAWNQKGWKRWLKALGIE